MEARHESLLLITVQLWLKVASEYRAHVLTLELSKSWSCYHGHEVSPLACWTAASGRSIVFIISSSLYKVQNEQLMHVSAPSPVGGGRPPGNPRRTHGFDRGFAVKIFPGDRVLLPFWQNSPGIYPRDLLMLWCREIQWWLFLGVAKSPGTHARDLHIVCWEEV